MKIQISSDAEHDLVDGYWFYERQATGLGDYFRSCMIADIDSLQFYAGIHALEFGFHRALCQRFPFLVYYRIDGDSIVVVAVLDARRHPSWTRERLQQD